MGEAATMHILTTMRRIEATPPLRTINGVGCRLSGQLALSGVTDTHLSTYWFTVLFLPILPLGLYVVSGGYPEYRFHGKVSVSDAFRAYGHRVWWLLASAWLEGAGILIGVLLLLALVGGLISLIRNALR